jgi:hypothetical protein
MRLLPLATEPFAMPKDRFAAALGGQWGTLTL